MANVITQQTYSFLVEGGIDALTSSNALYLAIGKTTAWPNDSNPPVPENTEQEVADFYTNLNAIQKIETTKILPAIRRINWTAGVEYDLFDPDADTSWDDNFYVLNSEDRVYKILTKVALSTTVTEPTGTGANIDTGDGYTWKYMFNVPLANQSLLTQSWIPVPLPSAPTTEQNASGDVDAAFTLGAQHIILRGEISDPSISDSISYRQIGLLLDPLDTGDTPITAVAEVAANIQAGTGRLLTIDNRTPVQRSTGQTESFTPVIRIY